MGWDYVPKPVEWANLALKGALHIANAPFRAVTALGHQMAGLQPLSSMDVIDYTLLGDDSPKGHLASYGELLNEQIQREGGPKLLGQIAGFAGDTVSDPLMLAGGIAGFDKGIENLVNPTTHYAPRPFPRRLSPLEKSDTALGGDMVGRVTQTTPSSQAATILERAESAGLPTQQVAGDFPTFTNRGSQRAWQQQGRIRKAERSRTGVEDEYQQWLKSRGQ